MKNGSWPAYEPTGSATVDAVATPRTEVPTSATSVPLLWTAPSMVTTAMTFMLLSKSLITTDRSAPDGGGDGAADGGGDGSADGGGDGSADGGGDGDAAAMVYTSISPNVMNPWPLATFCFTVTQGPVRPSGHEAGNGPKLAVSVTSSPHCVAVDVSKAPLLAPTHTEKSPSREPYESSRLYTWT